jgi:hypothetical protein
MLLILENSLLVMAHLVFEAISTGFVSIAG